MKIFLNTSLLCSHQEYTAGLCVLRYFWYSVFFSSLLRFPRVLSYFLFLHFVAMSKDMDSEVSCSLPCLFCGWPPLPDFDSFKFHFIDTYFSSYSFSGSWGSEKGLCVAKLVLLTETYYPYVKRKINIHVSECIDCDSLRVK